MSAVTAALDRPARERRAATGAGRLTRASGVGLGVAMLWFSLLVLLPLSAVVAAATEGGWSAFWRAVTTPQTAAAIRLTVGMAFAVTVVNVVMGTLIAWVLVRDRFAGKRLLEVLIDIPFALPTIVAGLVLLSLYGPKSPLGVNLANTRPAVFLAFLFVTLPFVVRTVQPVLLELGSELEEAAHTLGASRLQTFWHVILPMLVPALITGGAQSFVRSLGEFGAVVMIAGNMPFQTEVSSLMIFVRLSEFDYPAAAAIASVVLLASLLLLFTLQVVQSRVLRWQRKK